MKKLFKFIRLKKHTTSSAPTGSAPDVFILFAFAAFLLTFMGGCEYDMADLDTMSGTALHMNEDETDLQKKKAMPVPGPAQLLVTGLQGASGSTIGPGGALYATEGAVGRIIRVDPRTGNTSTFASGLPLFNCRWVNLT